jgi:hypothetical protein
VIQTSRGNRLCVHPGGIEKFDDLVVKMTARSSKIAPGALEICVGPAIHADIASV